MHTTLTGRQFHDNVEMTGVRRRKPKIAEAVELSFQRH
jgi:hypothetical protein